MQRVATTVVAVVGAARAPRACVERLAGAANVRTVLPDPDAPPLDRAVDAWSAAAGAHVPYLVHDADPLEAVADAWVRRFDGAGPVGELEVAVAETLTRWRTGSFELPDYYVVVDPDALGPTRRHWYLGLLHGRAPGRVVPVARPGDLRRELRRLAPARWWPPLDRLLDGIDRVVPDRVGIAAGA